MYALQKAAGLPSLSTVKHNRKLPRLLPCVSAPTEQEMKFNIESMLGPDGKPAPEKVYRELIGQVLIIDGAALEMHDPLASPTGCRARRRNFELLERGY